MREIEFYQSHLDGVSRSFAFCIQKLDSPYRQWISLSYLLCRVLDTVEDSPWSDVTKGVTLQNAQYAEFNQFMDKLPTREATVAWAKRFPESIPEAEKKVLLDSYDLFNDLHGLPENARVIIQNTVGKMFRGMRYYSNRSASGSLRLADLADANRYCYFVAGVVGELLSQLYVVYRPDFKPGQKFHTDALHFGLFLQKVNLLKDQRSDEREGRYLVPDRQVLLSSLRKNARGAMDYLLALPQDEHGYRTFCAWSLFLGAASLPYMEKAYEADDGSKIPRTVTQDLLTAIEDVVQDNVTLENAFQEYLPFIPEMALPKPTDSGDWFRDLTAGSLGHTEMAELGML
ncbi:MAG: squalene/phytoene synthase family protein [Bdellovibrionia bacterium]